MHTENCSSVKLVDSSEVSINSDINGSSILEDFANSSSTCGVTNKPGEEPEYHAYKLKINTVVYLNEDTMDCSYADSSGTPNKNQTFNDEISSPELFESDDETNAQLLSRSFRRLLSQAPKIVSPPKLTPEELVDKSDNYSLSRMQKFLTGIPPPPKHTICQSDCTDFLREIKNNRQFFWANPFSENKASTESSATKSPVATTSQIKNSSSIPRGRSLRNLTTAFDACDQSSSSISLPQIEVTNDSVATMNNLPNAQMGSSTDTSETTNGRSDFTESEPSVSSTILNPASDIIGHCELRNKPKVTFQVPQNECLATYRSIDELQAQRIAWPLIYKHKAHGIHYNRSKTVEEFENLGLKLCQRYIGNETQSTCTIWFTKQTPISAKERSLLHRRSLGQSPGKRLSHLARRSTTFSRANLKSMAEKNKFTLTVTKPIIKKGKSPRGKSPRGKSPRNSANKRLVRRLSLEGPSPRKSKIEISKRALFQSPPLNRAGPSRPSQITSVNNSEKIKRVLFPTPSKKEDSNHSSETKKRKNEEDLEAPKKKWAKSISFDRSYALDNSMDSEITRLSTSTVIEKRESLSRPKKGVLGEVNRKKLLWAVCEALRAKGISMGHPKFKQYASELAKAVRKYMPELENRHVPRKPGSTSDRMLKLAKTHALLVVETPCH